MTLSTELIASGLIETAEAQHRAAMARVVTVAEELDAARTALAAAKQASDKAIAGQGGDPHKAEIALEAAARALTVAGKVHAAAEQARADAADGVLTARGEAHKPVYIEGIRRRLAAAEKADKARELLAEAEADHAEATGLLNHATREGTQHVIYDQSHGRVLGTLADEIKLWSVPNSWWTGEPLALLHKKELV